jgi:hypothetical protein
MNNNEYFLVPHKLSINIEPIDKTKLPVDQLAFEDEIPAPFKMVSDLAQADASILAPLKLNSDTTQALWSYLQIQNQKINTLLSYVLTQQDAPQFHHKTVKFSAGCIIADTADLFSIGEIVKLKIFLPDESAAIYCYAYVAAKTEEGHKFEYTYIREQDRELLIRASLHIQTQQLKNRAQQRALKS